MRNELGEGIRAQRERMGLSLRAVASSVGISASMLSQVETGKLSPSVSTLYQIATYLDVSVDALLGLKTGEERTAEAGEQVIQSAVQRAEDNPRLEMVNGVTWERLATRPENYVEPTLVTFAPGAAGSPERKMTRHSGIEFGYLLEGELTLLLGFQQTALRAGDSFCFDAENPHLFINETEHLSRGIWFVAESWEPDWRDRQRGPGVPSHARVDAMKVLRTGI
ncbi:MAG: helix-turn-helix domain-containing protein [Actinomycetota bacterium]